MGIMLAIAALWGFAEATAFFIVPDVWISFIAMRRGWKAGVLAACLACIGALIGGAVMYVWGGRDAGTARLVLDTIPAISPAMIWMTGYELGHQGLVSVILGAFTGVPFKIYAVEAGAIGTGMMAFISMAVIARVGRFMIGALIAAAAADFLRRFFSERTILTLLAGFWILFYAWYFTVTG
jgi:membrane protein YqaA with SNARE-associated domain